MKVLVSQALTLALLFFMVGSYADSLPDYSSQFDPKRNAFEDLESAIAAAKMDQKLVLLEFGGDWCRWCHIMDAFFDDNPKIKTDLLSVFVLLKVNVGEKNENKKFLAVYPEIPGYPHFLILDKNGKLLAAQNTAKLESGESYSPSSFQAFINRWKNQ